MENIVVLMSTYNGEKYLKEQIESIINQSVKVKLIIRDDGSKDATKRILKEYEDRSNIEWYEGENVGFVKSFLLLLKNAPKAHYYAFSDQDDYWETNKIEKAIFRIKNENKPCLYCSNAILVDKNLREIGKYNEYYSNECKTLEDVIRGSFSAGCTMVFNRALANCINKYDVEFKDIRFHDRWVCFVASIFGKIIYDNDAYIKYRQHEVNVIGSKRKKKNYRWIKEKIKGSSTYVNSKLIKVRWNFSIGYCYQLLKGYNDDLNENQRQLINDIVFFNNNYKSRLRLLNNNKIFSKRRLNRLYVKLMILLGYN